MENFLHRASTSSVEPSTFQCAKLNPSVFGGVVDGSILNFTRCAGLLVILDKLVKVINFDCFRDNTCSVFESVTWFYEHQISPYSRF